jgi:hypothetical protein
VLWLLGLFLAGFPFFTFTPSFGLRESLARIRFLGVLPRLAICCVLGALLYRRLRARGLAVLVAVLLAGYWAVLAGARHLDSKSETSPRGSTRPCSACTCGGRSTTPKGTCAYSGAECVARRPVPTPRTDTALVTGRRSRSPR